MRKLVLTILVLSLPFVSEAQTLKHQFNEDKTVYLDFNRIEKTDQLLLFSIQLDGRECKKVYGSFVNLTEGKIEFSKGTTWQMEKIGPEEIRITFPKRDGKTKSVVYRKTEIDPKKFCPIGGKGRGT